MAEAWQIGAAAPSATQTSGLYSGNVAQDIGNWWRDISGGTAADQFNAAEAEKQRRFESSEAAINRNWQEKMSNTSYQRAMADMRAAGINPASLSGQASSFSPASTPGGDSARGFAASSAGVSGSGPIGALGKLIGTLIMSKTMVTANSARSAAKAASVAVGEASKAASVLNKSKLMPLQKRQAFKEMFGVFPGQFANSKHPVTDMFLARRDYDRAREKELESLMAQLNGK